ncbi:MAG: HU family DNA-binding protein [Zetaproteobacteria bacterium]|nr:HU family DNA-binding protein [Zetaproteobacteria bacterium]
MNKAELVECIAEEMEATKADAARFVDTLVAAIQDNIRAEGVKVAGLGSFSAKKRKARTGRNPQTGEALKIPAKWAPIFTASSKLKEVVKKKR